jgi:beta-glucosidase
MSVSLKRALFGAVAVLSLASLTVGQIAQAQTADAPRPWMNPALTPDQRADLVVKAMTLPEKMALVFGYFATDASYKGYARPKDSLADSAGFVYGVPRLGVPNQWETDAGVGVATQRSPHPRERTSPAASTCCATPATGAILNMAARTPSWPA